MKTVTLSDLNTEEQSIMKHTLIGAANGRYCGDSEAMKHLVALGLMESVGRLSFVPDEYFRLTPAGKTQVRLDR